MHPKHMAAALLHAAISHPDHNVRRASVNALKSMGFVSNPISSMGTGQNMPPPQGTPGQLVGQPNMAPPGSPGMGPGPQSPLGGM